MPELRWTLLILGVVFVAGLAWWERRRPHQASRQSPHIGGEPRPTSGNDGSWGPDTESSAPRVMREPTITLPEIRTEVRGEIRSDVRSEVRAELRVREPPPPRELPVVEIADDDSLIGLRVDGDRVEDEVAEEEAEAEEPEAEEAIVPIAPVPVVVAPAQLPVPPPPVMASVQPLVDWPPEEQRKLVALRLVAPAPERFQGRAMRQALAAEGFLLGKFDIFHKPDAENRAVLSAASLTKPGTFDLETMDTQRFIGLNLFAVLPGPKTPQRAFEDLLITARTLNERLQGALQDERGGPLTPTRIAAIRDGLGAGANS
jgi:cell division protein ZipA